MMLSGVQAFAIAQGAPPLQVDRIDARLFYHHSGTVSEPISERTALWNTIIGAGDAKEPSTSLLVDVIVKGVPGSYKPKVMVRLTTTSEQTGKVVSQQTKEVGVLSAEGEYHVGFWLTNTGCEPLHLTARLPGGNERKVHIPFKCGE
jgi:hypothetical protein